MAFIACVIASSSQIASAGLLPGQHSATPKLWSEGPWRVTNFTPDELDFRIGSLTPGSNHDLWFDENLRPHPFFIYRPKFAQLVDFACDSADHSV
jgi:hypothetical protein